MKYLVLSFNTILIRKSYSMLLKTNASTVIAECSSTSQKFECYIVFFFYFVFFSFLKQSCSKFKRQVIVKERNNYRTLRLYILISLF